MSGRKTGKLLTLILLGIAVEIPLSAERTAFRAATFNVLDVRTDDLKNPEQPRLQRIAIIIQRLHPDFILINEIAYDEPGSPGFEAGDKPGRNGQRLADNFIAREQDPNLKPLQYKAFMARSNTGLPSGFDLNNDGKAVAKFPEPPPASPDGQPGRQTAGGRAYGADTWGFGTFPGQYGMALLVKKPFKILRREVRTFQMFRWSAMPVALMPIDPETGEQWYSEAERAGFRLSSKSHWDVPLRRPGGGVVHLLCSHPTPPAFDGAEGRNKKRNHDEIRFWADYIDGANYFVDDNGVPGGLKKGASFIILGDLNADTEKGAAVFDPMGTFLLHHPKIRGGFIPRADRAYGKLDSNDTSPWGARIDYVLPSLDFTILGGGVAREGFIEGQDFPSDHFPVWLDLTLSGKD